MDSPTMQTLIIYHQVKPGVDCLDGISAAWVASKKYPNHELCGAVYNSGKLPRIEPNICRIVVVDFSFPAKVLEGWRDQVGEVIVIDHHKTAMKDLEGLSDKVLKHFDMNECGATLAWRTFFPDQSVPAFLDYVKDRDLWNNELPRTREVHETFSQMRYGTNQIKPEGVFRLLDALSRLGCNDLVALGIGIGGPKIKAKDEKVALIASRWEQREIVTGVSAPVVILRRDGSEDRLVSDICSKLYSDIRPDADFVACFTSDNTWSLRSDKRKSNGGFDVGCLAKKHGGGGHHNAAGFGPVEIAE